LRGIAPVQQDLVHAARGGTGLFWRGERIVSNEKMSVVAHGAQVAGQGIRKFVAIRD